LEVFHLPTIFCLHLWLSTSKLIALLVTITQLILFPVPQQATKENELPNQVERSANDHLLIFLIRMKVATMVKISIHAPRSKYSSWTVPKAAKDPPFRPERSTMI